MDTLGEMNTRGDQWPAAGTAVIGKPLPPCPGRLFDLKLPKSTAGYMVVIGNQLRKDGSVFIGFAPEGGVGDLLQLVQFGSPDHLVILHYFAATVQDVEDHRSALKQLQCRSDDTNWFLRHEVLENYLRAIVVLDSQTASAEQDDCEYAYEYDPQAVVALPLTFTPRTTKQQRRKNKRNTKRRRH